MQNQLLKDLRQLMELNYQKRFQEMQQNTKRYQTEETPKSFELPARNTGKEAQETSTLPELLTCWRCGKVGHKKKECTAILFCTNCGRNNCITSKCKHSMKIVLIVKEMITPKSIVQ